jgi:hypothetical protein
LTSPSGQVGLTSPSGQVGLTSPSGQVGLTSPSGQAHHQPKYTTSTLRLTEHRMVKPTTTSGIVFSTLRINHYATRGRVHRRWREDRKGARAADRSHKRALSGVPAAGGLGSKAPTAGICSLDSADWRLGAAARVSAPWIAPHVSASPPRGPHRASAQSLRLGLRLWAGLEHEPRAVGSTGRRGADGIGQVEAGRVKSRVSECASESFRSIGAPDCPILQTRCAALGLCVPRSMEVRRVLRHTDKSQTFTCVKLPVPPIENSLHCSRSRQQ